MTSTAEQRPLNAPEAAPLSIGVQPGTTGVLIGNTLIIFTGGAVSGIFVYNGTPALGNPPVFYVIAPGAPNVDPFGNPLHGAIMGVQGSPSMGSLQVNSSAQIVLSNSSGAVVSMFDPINSAIWQYQDLGTSSQGQLVFAQAAKAATDPVTSVAVQPGLTLFSTGGKKLWLDTSPASGQPGMSFFTGAVEENGQGAISAQVINPGASEALALQMFAATVTGFGSHPFFSLVSAAKDGSSPGFGDLEYVNLAGTTVSMLTWGVGGLAGQTDTGFAGGIDLTQTEQFTRATGNTTVHTQITQAPTINPGDWYAFGTTWEMFAWGNAVTGAAVGAVGFEYSFLGGIVGGISVTPPVAANSTWDWSIKWQIMAQTPGAAATCTVSMTIKIGQHNVTLTNTNTIGASQLASATVNTTAAGTAFLNAWFAGLSAGQTVQCVGSIFRRVRSF